MMNEIFQTCLQTWVTLELARLFGIQVRCRTSRKPRINSYALAIEAQAKYYLPQMFGQNHYQILTTPVELLKSLVRCYPKKSDTSLKAKIGYFQNIFSRKHQL